MERICNSLQVAGYQVLLVGREKASSLKLMPREFDQHRIKCNYESGKSFYIDYNFRLYRYLKSKKTKVFGAIDLDTIIPNYYAAKFRNAFLSFDAHEYFEEVPEVYNRKGVKFIWKKIGEYFVPKVQLAYTVGSELSKVFSEKYNIDFSVIRNVPLKINEDAAVKTDEKIILYQGMINRGRGVLEMIEAMSELPNWKFWIVGNGDLLGAAKRAAKNSPSSKQIKFYGFLPKNEILKITQQATLGLNLVSNEGLSYYYSLANKCFDYIQSGVPSIQMNYPEYAALNMSYDVFYLLENLTAESLIKQVKSIENNFDRHKILSDNNRRAAEELNWEKEEIKLISLYKRLLSDK